MMLQGLQSSDLAAVLSGLLSPPDWNHQALFESSTHDDAEVVVTPELRASAASVEAVDCLLLPVGVRELRP